MLQTAQQVWQDTPTFVTLSERDRRIIQLTQRKLRGAPVDFAEAMRALRESVEESIPDGKVFVLGMTGRGPILGSLISGVGIVQGLDDVQLVRVARDGRQLALGRLCK